jgi:hypothetical protein
MSQNPTDSRYTEHKTWYQYKYWIWSNIKYVFYRNTSILLIDTTYVIQYICDTRCTLVPTTFVTSYVRNAGKPQWRLCKHCGISVRKISTYSYFAIVWMTWRSNTCDVNYSPSLFTFLQIIKGEALLTTWVC